MFESRQRSPYIVTGLRDGQSEVRIAVEARIFYSMGSGAFPGMKRPGREADHLHLGPRLRMSRAIPVLPVHVDRDDLTFHLFPQISY